MNPSSIILAEIEQVTQANDAHGPARTVHALYLLEVLSGLGRGAFLVCIGWTTLVETGDVAKVGQVFVASMLTMLFGSHLVGVIVDRTNRRNTIWISHSVIALTMAVMGWALEIVPSLHVGFFFLSVMVITFSRIAYEFALDATLKQLVPAESLTSVIARARALHLLGTAAATVLVGWTLSEFGPGISFGCSAAFSVLLIALSTRLPNTIGTQEPSPGTGIGAEFVEGLALLRTMPGLLPVVLLAGIALPVGQLSNAILSSLVHDDLGMGSAEFGLVDGAWPIGGLAASILVGALTASHVKRLRIGPIAALVALSTMMMAFTHNLFILMIFHGCMGFFVWICRILVDAQVLRMVETKFVGRGKSNVTFAFGFFAVVMCLSPTAISAPTTGSYFLAWGGVVLVTGIMYELLAGSRRHQPMQGTMRSSKEPNGPKHE